MKTAVVILEWGGDGPAHSGRCVVRRTSRGFVVDDDVEEYGPFATIEAALTHSSFHFGGTPNPRLRCSPGMSETEHILAAAFDLAGEIGGEVQINGLRFRRKADGLVVVS